MDPTTRTGPNLNNELHDVVRLVRRTLRKWRPGAAAFGVTLVVAAAAIVFWPKEWKSSTVAYYRPGLHWSIEDAPNPRRMGERFRDSLLARALLTKVIEEKNLYPALVKSGRMIEAVEEMRLAVEFRIDQSDVYVISFTGDSPAEAQGVTARLAELLMEENARMTNEQAQVATDFLQSEKRRTETELGAKESALLAFLAKHPEFATEQSALGGSMRARSRPGAEAMSDHESEALAALRREEERLRRQLQAPVQSSPPQDPTLVAAREDAETKLRAAQRDLAEKKGNFTEQHPDVRAAEAVVKDALEAYKRATAALEAAEPRVLQGRLSEVQQEIATLRRLSGQGRPAVPDPSRNSEAARRVVADEAEWARLSREAAEARERFQQLESRQFVASMNANMAASGQSSQIVIIDPAFLPVRPSGPSRAARALIGAFFAMVVGFGVAFVLSLTDDRVVEGEDLERLQLAPVLLDIEKANMPRELAGPPHAVAGVVRAVPEAGGARRVALANIGRHARTEPAGAGTAIVLQASDPASALVRVHRPQAFQPPDPRLVLLTAPESRAAAAYRVLCHRLRERGNPRAILVTSPGRREGKSVLAANLALALVEGDRAKVVLLETHHESPTTGKLFGLEPPVGASEQIESHRLRPGQPWEAVETTVPKLHVVPLAPGSTTRPLLDATITQFVAAFRLAGYEYVVIDGPDALGSADVTLMQESADALLVAVRGGVTRLRTIRAAVDQVGATKLAGFTLFGSSPT